MMNLILNLVRSAQQGPQLTYAHVCTRMLTYAHVCSRMKFMLNIVRFAHHGVYYMPPRLRR
jgi:hypothetical protein